MATTLVNWFEPRKRAQPRHFPVDLQLSGVDLANDFLGFGASTPI